MCLATLDSRRGRCHRRRVATRTASRPVPAVRAAPRIARGLVYVLLLIVCTATAAYGGYVVGTRTVPTESSITTRQDVAVDTAVTRAVAAQKRADRAKRRAALRD